VTRTAFVLGGTGQVGRAVSQRLAEAGWEVTVGARRRRAAPSGVRSVAVDRHQPGALERVLGGGADVLVDVIAFTAGDAEQLNAFAGLVGSVIAISSAAVYTDELGRTLDEATDLDRFPELPVPIPETQPTVEAREQTYATRKVAMERALLEGPLPATIIRACAIHGPGASSLREWYFVKRALDGRPVVLLPDRGESRSHTTSVANLAELVAFAAERPGERILNCGDPDPPSVLEIERAIAAALAHEWTEVLLPQPFYAVPAACDTPWSVPRPFIVDMSAAERKLGYRPVVRYQDAVDETVAWLVDATRRRDWRDVVRGVVRHMENSFDYAAEDDFLLGLVSRP
jgi:nucleoside-diphosphate-sugar epimerase